MEVSALFQQLIQSAFDTGNEVIVFARGLEESFRGKVQDFDGESFTLFHSGCCHGLLWTFRLEDVLTCALVVALPSDPESHGQLHQPDASLPEEIKDPRSHRPGDQDPIDRS
jgi:hypothetical protein